MASKVKFVAIGVETVNSDLSSICQVGIATFGKSGLIDEWRSLVNPRTYFGEMNPGLRGVRKADLMKSPAFYEISEIISEKANGRVCVYHSQVHFEQKALEQAIEKDDLEPLNLIWLNSTEVARRTWRDVAKAGYGIVNVCKKIGYELEHRDALEDAKAAGHIMMAALEESGISLEDWLILTKQPNSLLHPRGKSIKRNGNFKGKLRGEVLVFAGRLGAYRRAQAADLIAYLGCDVRPKVTQKTTLLVVGDQGAGKPLRNYQEAKERIKEGQRIKIIDEDGFVKLIRDNA